MSEKFLKDRVELHCGDCLEILPTLADNSIDSCVTDPPYHLTSIVKRFGKEGSAPAQHGMDGRFQRVSRGFMAKEWDGGNIAFRPEVWAEVYRVLKPGAHLLAFGGTRTYHRMTCAIEDAGFEIRDTIMWLYGSGFPKSHDVSKGIDKAAGVEREIVGTKRASIQRNGSGEDWERGAFASHPEETKQVDVTAPATATARQWQGWGTALKPACEPIVLARKPLSEGTVAANVLKHGVGALNIDGCRVVVTNRDIRDVGRTINCNDRPGWGLHRKGGAVIAVKPEGRWPANLIHDGSEEVVEGFPESQSGVDDGRRGTGGIWQESSGVPCGPQYGDSGSVARFFYTTKADGDDRLGSKHPTVKPLDLMQYLVRLVTPKSGIVLDMFAGTGTTGEAAWREGCKAVLVEREAEYQSDIRRRMELVLSGPDERARETIKQKLKDKPLDAGPLFRGE